MVKDPLDSLTVVVAALKTTPVLETVTCLITTLRLGANVSLIYLCEDIGKMNILPCVLFIAICVHFDKSNDMVWTAKADAGAEFVHKVLNELKGWNVSAPRLAAVL